MTIPHWDQILEMAATCHEIAQLDYLGVDIVLDETLGPLMLELNARPGLNIQLCNNHGLLPVLRKAQAIQQVPGGATERVAIGKQLSA